MKKLLHDILEHKVARFVCFFVIALMAVFVTWATKMVLGWFHYDDAQRKIISEQAGEYFGSGVLFLMFVIGMILIVRRLSVELKSKNKPPLAAQSIPPLPPGASRPTPSTVDPQRQPPRHP